MRPSCPQAPQLSIDTPWRFLAAACNASTPRSSGRRYCSGKAAMARKGKAGGKGVEREGERERERESGGGGGGDGRR